MKAYEGDQPLVFNHIPKTAGTSVSAALSAALQPQRTVSSLDLALVGAYDDFDAIHPAMRAGFVFSPEELPADADFITGHISPGTTMVRYPRANHMTILRNPQARTLSQWMHGRSLSDFDLRHWGLGLAFRAGWRPLHEYLQHEKVAPNIDNTITRFLLWPHPALAQDRFIEESLDEELFAAGCARIDSFGFVNVLENRDFMTELGSWLGRELTAVRLNERRAYPPARPTDLEAELDGPTRELLAHRSRIDTRLWTYVAERVLPGADHAAVLESSLATSVAGYRDILNNAVPRPLKRRVADRIFRTKAILDPRLKGFR